MSRAKRAAVPSAGSFEVPKPIPRALGDHLDQQQRAAYTIEALLNCVTQAAVEARNDDIEWSLEHIIKLVHQLGTELDGATVTKICAAQTVQS